jgi:transcription antitermination factor NusA-like protein
MHKKLKAELVSLANSILALQNDSEIQILYAKAQSIYEKLAIAKFLNEEDKITTDTVTEKGENLKEIENKFNEELIDEISQRIENEQYVMNSVADTQKSELFFKEEDIQETPEKENEVSNMQISLEEEFKDAISATEATKIFESATKESPIIFDKTNQKNRTLNDALFKNNLQIGLNDRIAFVNQLFEGSQEDFNRVISQLNTFNTEIDAKTFLLKVVKPDYDWSSKIEYEERLLTLIERKFT